MNQSKTLVFASKNTNSSCYPEELIDDWDKFHSGFEYGDVKEGEYQIWEYPSGKIFNVIPDRKVPDNEYYTTPYTTKGIMWLPKLVRVEKDPEKVKRLTSILSLDRNQCL